MKTLIQMAAITAISMVLSACPANVPVKPDGENGAEGANGINGSASENASNAQNTQPGSTTSGLAQGQGLDGQALGAEVINNPVCAPDCVFHKDAINQSDSTLANKIIYFDFDQSSIKDEFLDLIEQHAIYLNEFPDTQVRLEGHGDERGTREYNIALAERRAIAVKRQLLLHGVSDSQISHVSFGEELPAQLGHDEESWSLNRRVEIVYE